MTMGHFVPRGVWRSHGSPSILHGESRRGMMPGEEPTSRPHNDNRAWRLPYYYFILYRRRRPIVRQPNRNSRCTASSYPESVQDPEVSVFKANKPPRKRFTRQAQRPRFPYRQPDPEFDPEQIGSDFFVNNWDQVTETRAPVRETCLLTSHLDCYVTPQGARSGGTPMKRLFGWTPLAQAPDE